MSSPDPRTIDAPDEPAASFAAELFTGRIASDAVLPFPEPDDDEVDRVRSCIDDLTRATADYDPREAERDRWVGDDVLSRLGEAGLMGLSIDPEYGGLGLSHAGYCRVFEEIGRIDATLSVVLGVHQSIGMKGIHVFGTDDQKERYLPDLAAGRKLAAFALTEPNAGPTWPGRGWRVRPSSWCARTGSCRSSIVVCSSPPTPAVTTPPDKPPQSPVARSDECPRP